jgi:hypothetical protein
MSKYVVTTQLMENTGLRVESGRCNSWEPHWKFTDQNVYIVEDVGSLSDAVAFVEAAFSENEIDMKEFPVKWTTFIDYVSEGNSLNGAVTVSPEYGRDGCTL